MARDAARLAQLFLDDFEKVAADAMDASAVAQALDGCSGVHICVAHGKSEAPIVETVARAARQLRLSRVSYVSGTSVCEANAWFPMVADKLRAERAVQACGVPFTIFRPTWFMEAIAHFIQHGRAVCLGRGQSRFHLVASEDFAAQVPRAYSTRATENREYRLLGPQPIQLFEAIDRYRAALHPEIARVMRLPLAAARVIAMVRGKAGREMGGAVEMLRYFEKVSEGDRDARAEELLGCCPTTFDAWLARRQAESRAVAPRTPM